MARGTGRQAGEIEVLPSGALRVKVYAGVDPVTKRRHYLRETIPAGPKAEREAKKVLARLVAEIYERRNPRTSATVAQLLERYLDELRLERKTLKSYRGFVAKHVVPFIGKAKVGTVDADVLDSLYAELLRCRDHCDQRKQNIDHRDSRPHDCDDRCKPHICIPLAESTVRKIHWILSGAFRRAQRWKWISISPMTLAEPPGVTPSNPRPPTPAQTARIVNDAWTDPDWATLIWLTMVTGLRRGELCAIRWRHIDFDTGVLHLERRIGQIGAEIWEAKSTKTHTDRRIVLDPETVELLRDLHRRCASRCLALGFQLPTDAFVFSLDPDGSRPRRPDSVTQRYGRMCRRLGIASSIHKLRHYSATELIAAGVDIRTVAGRLGHAGGGATTLRTYAAWVAEADQRAAGEIAGRMPARPRPSNLPEPVETTPVHPYEKIAVELRDRIYSGELRVGLPIPPMKQLAREMGVSSSTLHRAIKLLTDWGLVRAATGRPTLVQPRRSVSHGSAIPQQNEAAPATDVSMVEGTARALDLEIRRLGEPVASLRAHANPEDPAILHRHLVSAIKRVGGQPEDIDEYELIVRWAGDDIVRATYVAVSP
jgi:integrase/DNA-binding FadR family transcriptional regulator